MQVAEVRRNENDPSTISSLNDDCLLEVFSNLSAINLGAIKRSSRRFSKVADLAAQHRYRDETFEYCTSADHGTSHSACVAALREFGPFMRHIRIEMDCFCRNYDRAIYGSAGFGPHNCSGEQMLTELAGCTHLKSLCLVRVQLHNVSTRKVSRTLAGLQHLETLQLIECAGLESNISRLVKSCRTLKYLTVHAKELFSWISGVTDDLLADLGKQQTLEYISFKTSDFQSNFVANVMELRHLNGLKKLELECGESLNPYLDLAPAIDALAATDSLDELILKDLMPTDAIGRALDRFSHLKVCVILCDSKIADDVLASTKNFKRTVRLEHHTCKILNHTEQWHTLTLLRKE